MDAVDLVRPDVRKTRYILLPKLHVERCVMEPAEVHISKKTKKRSKGFIVSINEAFAEVLDACVQQHGEGWLVPPLQSEFKRMFNDRLSVNGTRLYSVEIWKEGKLAAGEIGSTIGGCYCSLTGFYRMDSAGTIQLCVLGSLLHQLGYTLWDLGMSMDYKLSLGAKVIPRSDFVDKFRKARMAETPQLSVSGRPCPVDCSTVLKKELVELATP
eukprot:GHVS01020654.1.p1 GENE.GHVS01020654.1~~GHVS01020654.1.p1  ORF type:complete len:213 (-),score=19.98 GHVS01020654.1:165-803(-)